MQCPVCNVKLKMADRQGIEIDYCPQCRGVWLDRGELDEIIKRTTFGPSRQATLDGDDDDESYAYEKRKRGTRAGDILDAYYDDEDDDRDRHGRRKRRGGFLGEVFDIFGD